MSRPDRRNVAVIGGGLAGLAASLILSSYGIPVILLEARQRWGGRAGGMWDRSSQRMIDLCQHVVLGCCTNYLDFCARTDTLRMLRKVDRVELVGPDGRRGWLQTSRMPAPLHMLRTLSNWPGLNSYDRCLIIMGMARMMKASNHRGSFQDWLESQGQSERAIRLFWSPIVVSAISEIPGRLSLQTARHLFIKGFLGNSKACEILRPSCFLNDMYEHIVRTSLSPRGVMALQQKTIEKVHYDGKQFRLQLQHGEALSAEACILGVPWYRVRQLLGTGCELNASLECLSDYREASITSVHLWFDRGEMQRPPLMLLDRLTQWVFPAATLDETGEAYYQVVISASRSGCPWEKQQLVAQVVDELRSCCAELRQAKLIRHLCVTEPRAVFIPPLGDHRRPGQKTHIPHLYLAGDWTDTGWPATMEGAVRSGYLAAEACLKDFGIQASIVQDDLPEAWSFKLFRNLIP